MAKACKVLATHTPLIVGVELTESFWEVLPGTRIWDPAENEGSAGKHAMLLVGYDNVEKHFLLMNSFGPGWGDNGFIRLPYDDFERLCRYAYLLIMDERAAQDFALSDRQAVAPIPGSKPGSLKLKGEMVFRRPAGYLSMADGTEVPFFEEVPAQWQPGTFGYEPFQPHFAVGDAFQLVARHIPQGQYAYVFSYDPLGITKLHFPRLQAQKRTAGFVLSAESEIVIPGDETILQLVEPGADYLCILYSAQELPGIEQRLQMLQPRPGEAFSAAFLRVFDDLLIPMAQIRFSSNKMAFEADADLDRQQIAVPLFLKVIAK